MVDKVNIFTLIKDSVVTTAPGATVILYGSYARGDFKDDSDIDLLILVDKDKLSSAEEDRITFPLYDLEHKNGIIISPLVYTKKAWSNHMVTPFYENVNREGRVL